MTVFRPGDIVNIEMEIRPNVDGDLAVGHPDGIGYAFTNATFAELNAAGKVTLVRRAEPDWQPGDIGLHTIIPQAHYAFMPRVEHDDEPWLSLASGARRSRRSLAGKLVRCAVIPEVTP